MNVSETPDTRQRIMDAAYALLRDEGITAASARAIAAEGGFNQALIFYHFGSIDNLLTETARAASARRIAAYSDAAEATGTMSDLVALARRLHAESTEDGSVAVLIQLMAGAASDPTLADAVMEGFEGWVRLVERAYASTTDGTPLAPLVPARQAAYAISALFLGMELMERLAGDQSETEEMFVAFSRVARMLETLLPLVAGLEFDQP